MLLVFLKSFALFLLVIFFSVRMVSIQAVFMNLDLLNMMTYFRWRIDHLWSRL